VAFAPGASFPRHRHPGEEVIYVLNGMIEYELDGKPPVTLQAGDVLFVPDGAVHAAKNVGIDEAAELGTYIVEKGKPLTEIIK
jgi:quercetin dioxygenase-like cupin family protein